MPARRSQAPLGNTLSALVLFAGFTLLGGVARAAEEGEIGAARSPETAVPSARVATQDEPSEPSEPEEMVVTASRSPRTASRLPVFATVLDGEAIGRGVSTSLDDALRFIPALHLTRQGGRGARTALSLRGLDPNHTVVLIDGVRLNDPTNARGGSFDPTTLSLIEIDRVEIVRGPLGAVYGSDALAGAINIITRSGEPGAPAKGSVTFRGGRFHTGQARAEARTGLGRHIGFSLGASLDTTRDPNSDGGYDGANLKAKWKIALPGDFDAEVLTRLHQSSARSFPESSGGSELATLRSMEDRDVREILAGLRLSGPITDAIRLTFEASHADRRERLRSPGIDRVPPLAPFPPEFDVPPSRAGDEYRRTEVSADLALDAPIFTVASTPFATRILVGGEFIYEDGESDTFLDFTGVGNNFVRNAFFDHRQTVGLYAEVEESIGPYLTLSGSVRYDTTPDENDRLSPAAGLSLILPGTGLTLFGQYSEGFKRPSFYALGNPIVGNPALFSEKSRGFEVGLRGAWATGRLRGQLSYFDYKVRDLIDFNDATFTLVNQNALVSRGAELEFSAQVHDAVELRGGATYNYTNFAGSGGADPENRPRWRGFAAVIVRPLEALEVSARVLAVSSVKATSFRTSGRVDTLSGYERVDVRASWTTRLGIELFVEIENLTNATPRDAVGFETPGIAPRAGLTIRN